MRSIGAGARWLLAGASAAVFAVMGAGVTLGLGRSGDRRWAVLSAAAVAAGLGLGVLLVPVFGSDVLYAHVYGSTFGLLGGLVPRAWRPARFAS